jgi:hypothetical protein
VSLHIHKFVDLVKATESRGQRDLHMSLRDAKDLHADITKLLLTLEQLRENTIQVVKELGSDDIEINGGNFKNS